MEWWTLLLLGLGSAASLIVATTAIADCLRTSRKMSALSASLAAVSTKLGEIERTERLTPSMLAELADVRDAIAKGNALLKRVNSRETMRERRESGALDTPVTKEELRARAGLIAGRPAPHK